MKFRVKRVSVWDPTKSPTPRAKKNSAGFWVLEVKTLAGLLKFVENEGAVILDANDILKSGLPVLTIYDDYIE